MKIINTCQNNYHIKDGHFEIFVRMIDGKLFYSVWRIEDFKEFCNRPLEMLSQLKSSYVPEILITIRKAKLEKLLK